MNKRVTLLFSILCSIGAFADGVTPGIIISKTDSSKASIAIAELKSIKFSDGAMIVNMKDNSQQSFNTDEVTNITFGDIPTAISTLYNGSTSAGIVSISDISGRAVYNGKAIDAAQVKLPAGIYVVTANGKSLKVMIK